jgi:hypothetical protein
MNIKNFYRNTKKLGKCIEWTGAIDPNGYGAIKENGKKIGSHRWIWKFYRGDIEKGIFICHKCDNRRCVKISHLFKGTNSENMKDAAKKGRLASQIKLKNKVVCWKRGHNWALYSKIWSNDEATRFCSECRKITRKIRYEKKNNKIKTPATSLYPLQRAPYRWATGPEIGSSIATDTSTDPLEISRRQNWQSGGVYFPRSL